jgi:hypothetical protein
MTPVQIIDILVQAGVALTYAVELLHRAICALGAC